MTALHGAYELPCRLQDGDCGEDVVQCDRGVRRSADEKSGARQREAAVGVHKGDCGGGDDILVQHRQQRGVQQRRHEGIQLIRASAEVQDKHRITEVEQVAEVGPYAEGEQEAAVLLQRGGERAGAIFVFSHSASPSPEAEGQELVDRVADKERRADVKPEAGGEAVTELI